MRFNNRNPVEIERFNGIVESLAAKKAFSGGSLAFRPGLDGDSHHLIEE